MKPEIIKILSVTKLTHDVLEINAKRPDNLRYIPGQSASVSINKEGWQDKKRSFTFTTLPDDEFLKFIIKTYPERKGVTNELLNIGEGDELIIHEIYGSIAYKGEGVFIAGGAGITPFIAIFRYLASSKSIGNNKLVFANKTEDDIILRDEFKNMLGDNFINILSDENREGYHHGFVTEDFIKPIINDKQKYVYVCGPPMMMVAVNNIMGELQIDKSLIIK